MCYLLKGDFIDFLCGVMDTPNRPWPVPTNSGPMPTKLGPMPTKFEPMPTKFGPMPTNPLGFKLLLDREV